MRDGGRGEDFDVPWRDVPQVDGQPVAVPVSGYCPRGAAVSEGSWERGAVLPLRRAMESPIALLSSPTLLFVSRTIIPHISKIIKQN